MQAIAEVQTAVCKSLQSIGLSPRKEHQIENAIATQLKSSGPEFLLSRFSDLNDWRKMHMTGDITYHPEWHKWKKVNGKSIPADAIGAQLWGLSDKAFFAATGAITKAVELAVPSEKQLLKWLDGVRCENRSTDKHMRIYASRRLCDRIESELRRKWSGRDWFNVSDISGTNIPGSGKFMSVKVEKGTSMKDPVSLLAAYGFSVGTAPLFVWQFLKDIDAPSLMAEGIDNPEELIDTLGNLISRKLGDYRLQDEAEMGSTMVSDEAYLAQRGQFYTAHFGFLHSVGNIGFLEQGKGKLRTVANPNRLVQYVNVPLGEVLGDQFYYRTGICVLNQEEGLDWAQEKLRQGVTLSSFDMSAATDRLDYKKFLVDYFSMVYREPDQFPLFSRSLDLFEDTSSGVWSIPGHIADLVGANDTKISWSVGQPLGLRPSFPILTIMNSKFAECAVRDVDGQYTSGHYACVGDDLIIEAKYANAYMAWVTAYNGKINNEKAMVSNRYAEFCSQLVTRSTRFPLKPSYALSMDGSLQNVERFSTDGLRPNVPNWVRDLHHDLAQYHLDGFNTIKYKSTAGCKPLDERLSLNALITAVNPAPRDPDRVTLQTLYLRALVESEELGDVPVAKELSSSYADSAYPAFGGHTATPNVVTTYKKLQAPSGYQLGDVSTDRSTSVDLPIKTEWSWQKSSYARPASELTQAKKLSRKLKKVSVVHDGDLTEASICKKGITHTVVSDASSPTPTVLLAVNDGKGHESVADITSDVISDKTGKILLSRKAPAKPKPKPSHLDFQHDCSDDYSL